MCGHGSRQQPARFIDAGMRRIAVSWMLEVSCESSLHQETLFLATSLLDRFLSSTTVSERPPLPDSRAPSLHRTWALLLALMASCLGLGLYRAAHVS